MAFALSVFKKIQGVFTDNKKSLVFRVVLFLIPLLLSLAWHTTLSPDAYAHFAAVENHLVSGPTPLLTAPLYTALLFPAARLGLPLDIVGTVLSSLGWGILNLVLYETGRALQYPVGAALAAALMAFSPCFTSILGMELVWVLVSFWVAIMFCLYRRPRWVDGALILMLLLHLGPVTLIAAAVILIQRWRDQNRVTPYLGTGIWFGVTLGWGLATYGFRSPA